MNNKDIYEIPTIQKHKVKGIYESVVKRVLDITFSVISIICLSWLMLIIYTLVRINLGSPAIFIQERIGKNGKTFKLYKFRSMSNEMDKDGNLLPAAQRLSSLGRLLRSTSMDELPELINIFKGDMSIVGPRPLLVEYLNYYNTKDARRHEVLPGLTGLAQVSGRNALTWGDKFHKDVEYVDNITFIGDIKIVLLTVAKLLKKEGVEFLAGHQSVMEYFKRNADNTDD